MLGPYIKGVSCLLFVEGIPRTCVGGSKEVRWKRSVSMKDREWEDDCAWNSARVLMGVKMGMLLLCNKINC